MIVASAIKFCTEGSTYPVIWCCKRHSDIFDAMYNNSIKYDKPSAEQDFLTENDRFLDRYEARTYAWECGQIKEYLFAPLYSEDLW